MNKSSVEQSPSVALSQPTQATVRTFMTTLDSFYPESGSGIVNKPTDQCDIHLEKQPDHFGNPTYNFDLSLKMPENADYRIRVKGLLRTTHDSNLAVESVRLGLEFGDPNHNQVFDADPYGGFTPDEVAERYRQLNDLLLTAESADSPREPSDAFVQELDRILG